MCAIEKDWEREKRGRKRAAYKCILDRYIDKERERAYVHMRMCVCERDGEGERERKREGERERGTISLAMLSVL